MAREKYYNSCPYCGDSDTYQSVYTKMQVTQYYDWNGNPNGFVLDSTAKETKSVYCSICHRRITTLERLVKQGKERGLYDG